MNPFFFGTADRALYGAYHPPVGRVSDGLGAVLCYPTGVEYMRAHRAFRQLTTLLTRAGVHVLRFDYYGTGDSAGRSDEATIGQWRQDVGSAVQELKDMTGLSRVTVVGLRMGAAVAAQAVLERDDVDHLVLWDPIVRGERYLQELRDEPADTWFPSGTDRIGVHGYPMTTTHFDEIRTIRLDHLTFPLELNVDLVCSHESREFTGLADHLRKRGGGFSQSHVPSDGAWGEINDFGAVLMPQGIIHRIVDRVAGMGVA